MNKKIKNYINNLSKYINNHNNNYFILNKPIISNYKYDKKLNLLIKLEKKYNYFYKNSPTKKLNNNLLIKNFNVIKHFYKMYSIKNVYNKKNFIIWKKNIDNKISKKINYICELKYDGIAISIIYEYGKLKYSITRGDGIYGNIVTKNILYIKNIPKYIKKIKNIKLFDIKGEIVYSKKNFLIINKIKKKKGEKLFSNSRNAVNGIIHSKYNKYIIYKKYLDFIPYYIYTNDKKYNYKINNQLESIKFLKNLSFNFIKKSYKLCNNTNNIIKYIYYWEKNIYKSIYPIDGIVIKVNNLKLKKKLNNNNIFHKWCIAFKFKDKKFITKVKKVNFYIGKTGIIVPVVYFKKIIINGTKIKRSNLYNSNIFKKYNLSFNDKIIIKKSGDIIPKIVNNITYKKIKKKKNYKYINFPLYCPSCNSFLKKKNEKLYCYNYKCNIQILEKIKHFISKYAMNIKINKNIINKLFFYKKINNYIDLLILKKKDFFLFKITNNEIIRILNEIKKSKKKKFNNILFSLSIPSIGKYISKKIEKTYNNIFNLLKDIKNNNIKCKNIGKKKIKNINKFFKKKINIKIIKKLKKLGYKI
ncbi:MAG: NAD-dependent DNA ligase LigA [Candidatus Shikimatogenerans bostrichidophilus]|nr:MAG: NAD-dependent DNA ligase LigA [Candidatus Shikimatogenerans bostrichidophilus]